MMKEIELNRRTLRFENLEERRLLAIVWANEFGTGQDDPEFFRYFDNEPAARAAVNRAIDDWNRVIGNFNFADPNRDFELTVRAGSPSSGAGEAVSLTEEASTGTPMSATVIMAEQPTILVGSELREYGWFFDQTPNDDVEFTGLANEHAAVFVDQAAFVESNPQGQNRVYDYYRIVSHEIGHAVGFAANYDKFSNSFIGNTAVLGDGQGNPLATMQAYLNGHFSRLEHPDFVMSAPNEVFLNGLFYTAPYGDPPATLRLFISDFEAQILEEIYGYDVNLPSSFDTAHVMHDSITGQLLVQGAARDSAGVGIADTIDVEIDGGNVKVTVANANGMFVEKTPTADVTEIIVHGNGGSDTLNGQALGAVSSVAGIDVTVVDYVVSSNQDELEGPTSVGNDAGVPDTDDGIVDISPEVPGSQTTLRAAIVEANERAGEQKIYVGRGLYDLQLGGSGGSEQGDFDVDDELTLVGAGAGATIINTNQLSSERHFQVSGSGGALELRKMTLTGGTADAGASIRVDSNTNPSGVALTLSEVAVANNGNGTFGGGVSVGAGAKALIERSVITNDSAAWGGGGIAAEGNGTEVTLAQSIVADNDGGFGDADIATSGSAVFLSDGHNLIGDVGSANFAPDPSDRVSGFGFDDYVVTSVVDTFETPDDDYHLSLREAVRLANLEGGSTVHEIWAPAWRLDLTRGSTAADDEKVNDIDVTSNVKIVGVGAGGTIISAAGLASAPNLENRAFHVHGAGASLELSRMTVAGGDNRDFNLNGTAVALEAGAAATIVDSAITDHFGFANGVAVRSRGGDLTVLRSVFANNTALAQDGAIYATKNAGVGSLTIGDSVFANNSGGNGFITNNVLLGSGVTASNLGNNLVDDAAGGFFDVHTSSTDHIGNADYVVTSVMDTFDHTDDDQALSLREAVDLANASANSHVVIFVPDWQFLLRRRGEAGAADHSIEFGDLDITNSLTIRGAGASPVQVTQTVAEYQDVDAVFDLLGNGVGFGDSRVVNTADCDVWDAAHSSGVYDPHADFNDDGVVDNFDHDAVFIAALGNTLDLFNMQEA